MSTLKAQLKNRSQVKTTTKKALKKAKLVGIKRISAKDKEIQRIANEKREKLEQKFYKNAIRIWNIIVENMRKKKPHNDDAVYFVECIINSDLKELKQGLTDKECLNLLKRIKFIQK